MKKKILKLSAVSLTITPLITTVGCGSSISQEAQAQKDVDWIQSLFERAHLIVTPQDLVLAKEGDFDLQSFKNMGGAENDYPKTTLPKGVNLTYEVGLIKVGEKGNAIVTVSKAKAISKTFNVFIDVSKVPTVKITDEDSALQNANYDSKTKTITIGDKVSEINFNLSTIVDKRKDKAEVKCDIQNINWGNNPQNILKIGFTAFEKSKNYITRPFWFKKFRIYWWKSV